MVRRALGSVSFAISAGSIADLAEAGRLLQSAAERRSDTPGEIREHLLARHLEFFAAHVVERPAGDEHGHDVGLRQLGIRRQRRLGVARRAGDRDVMS